MKRAIRNHLRDFIAILALTSVALSVAYYILQKQRLRLPFLEEQPFELKAEMQTAQAVTPGQGQTVRIAGIRIGDIAKTELKEGRAIITLHIDQEYKDIVRRGTHALLRPRTGLKDMFLELNPAGKDQPLLEEGDMIPVHTTLPDVNPDEVLAGLDADTRDYVRLLLDGAGKGLKGRGEDLSEVLRRFEPTYRDLAAVNTEVVKRREELRRLINALQRLNTTLGRKDDDLAELVQNANRVFRAIASERQNVSAAVRELPPTLRQATTTLRKVEELANVLGPAAEEFRPAVVALREANLATRPFALDAAPRIRDDIRPFVREARPLIRDLAPAARDLADGAPGLRRTFRIINRFYNMLAYNTNGREGPDVADRDEGYLFYTGWLIHQVNNLFRSLDAHGPGRPITFGGTCAVIENTLGASEELEALLGLTGALTDPLVCGNAEGTGGAAALLEQIPLTGELPPLPRTAEAKALARKTHQYRRTHGGADPPWILKARKRAAQARAEAGR
ncbi:MAG: MlaD family protein [Actinomycetota bacterium]|nr:MlaD family protein [Actinomycetota bacterium]MDQ5807590.1 MlaD family protein [Actinomycetota bacterium]